MAASHLSGPLIISGEGGSTYGSNPEAGPSGIFQGITIPDVRSPYNNGVTGVGRIAGFLDSPSLRIVDAVPAAVSLFNVAAAQTATSGTPLALVNALGVGVAPNTPIRPFGAGPSTKVNVLMLDPGFAIASTTAGSAVITVSNAAVLPRLQSGLNVAVAAGPGSTWLFATVLSVAGTQVTLSAPMGATVAAAPVALANASGRRDEAPNHVTAYLTAGAVAAFDPRSSLMRVVSVGSNNAGDTGWAVTVRGYDAFGNPLTDVIAVGANAVVTGQKGFKSIASVTPSKSGGGTSAGTISVGTSDIVTFPLRADQWENVVAFYAGAQLAASTGWTPADTTAPATGATGDTRGRLQLGSTAGGAPDGTKRLVLTLSVPLDALVFARNSNPASLYGVAQFAG